jgi:hypothetical protein
VLENSEAIHAHALYLPTLLLVLVGAFTKSAQMPFHFWLPNAMAAPTPVSAYLHSATMVKAGIFLLARFNPLLGDTAEWHNILTIVGAITMLGGALLALPQSDLKLLLAYSTISALGALVLLLGIGTTLAMQAAVVYLLVHSLYKGALFMVAGAVDHGAGTRDVRALSGLIRIMPITAVAAGLAALSMSGFPPLLGFIGKELLYEAKVQSPDIGLIVTAFGVAANVAMVAVALIIGFTPFHGAVRMPKEYAHEPSITLWLGPAVLAAISAVLGLFPGLIDQLLVAPATTAVRARETVVELKLWHGINPVLMLSFATVLAGVAVYAGRSYVERLAVRLRPIGAHGPERWYELALAALIASAAWQTRWLQQGKLRHYVFVVLAVSMVSPASPSFGNQTSSPHSPASLSRSGRRAAHHLRGDRGRTCARQTHRGRRARRGRIRHCVDLRNVRCAGPRDDSDPGRDADARAVRSRRLPPAAVLDVILAAETLARRGVRHRCRRRHHAVDASRLAETGGPHGFRLFRREQPARGRAQRRQRDPGRLSRARHVWRDRSARCRRARRVRADAAAAAGREERRAGIMDSLLLRTAARIIVPGAIALLPSSCSCAGITSRAAASSAACSPRARSPCTASRTACPPRARSCA